MRAAASPTFPLIIRSPRETMPKSGLPSLSSAPAAAPDICTRPGSDVVSMRAAVLTCGWRRGAFSLPSDESQRT